MCSLFVPVGKPAEQNDEGQLHTLGLLEELRDECNRLWGASSDACFRVDDLLRQPANPNLHDIPANLPFRVELWDRHDRHIRWVISASASLRSATPRSTQPSPPIPASGLRSGTACK
jgi:hypothetical protein